MVREQVLAAILLFFPQYVAVAEPVFHPYPSSDCALVACRPAGTAADFWFDDGTFRKSLIEGSPYVFRDGTIEIYPGETLNFDFPQASDQPGIPRYLSNTLSLGTTSNRLTLAMRAQIINGMTGVVLTLQQTFAKPMKLDAAIAIAGPDGLDIKHTSICPLMPGQSDAQSVSVATRWIQVRNLRLLPVGASAPCE